MNNLERFVQAATAGAHPDASQGEKIANRIAQALHEIGDDAAVVDRGIIEGAAELLRMMNGPWPTTETKFAVFRTVEKAAKGEWA